MAGEYFRPSQLEEAIAWQARHLGVVAAGCTDLFAATQAQSLTGPVLDLTAIDQLRGISTGPDHIDIGATCTWSDIVAAPLPAAFDGLKQAALEIGSVQIQNRATIGGNLCHASPAADSVPPLLTLDASVQLRDIDGARQLPLADFLSGPRQTAKRSTEILEFVRIPVSSTSGQAAFTKLGARRFMVISIAMVAARLKTEAGKIEEAAISVGACGPVACRLEALETHLIGKPASAASFQNFNPALVRDCLNPIDDIRADRDYRLDTATHLVRHLLTDLAKTDHA